MLVKRMDLTIPTVRCFLYVRNCEEDSASPSEANYPYGDGEMVARSDLEPDENKKSVLWLRNSESRTACSCVQISAEADHTVYFGGFQMTSTAKSVEVYINNNTALLMTVRGIRSPSAGSDASWTKAQCVVPGGARPVQRVRLVLKGGSGGDASSDTGFLIQTIRWTVRVPAITNQNEQGESTVTESPAQALDSTVPSISVENPEGGRASSVLDRTVAPTPTGPFARPDSLATQALSVQLSLMTQQMAALTTAMNGLNATIRAHHEYLVEQENQGNRSADDNNEN